jgi:PD-(D/E)XK nuclease superfamily
MPVLQFGRYRDLATAVAERLRKEPLEVIVASGGVRSAVLRELLLRAPSGVVSARLDGIDAFARRVLNEAGDYPRPANDAERRLAMRVAVRTINDPILESRGVAAMLERSYRDVRDGGTTLDDFEVRMHGTRMLRNRGRTQLVMRVWREYERLIAALGCIDPADLLARAAQRVSQSTKPQLVAGFYDMTGAQARLVEALRERGRLEGLLIPVTDDEHYAFAATLIARFGHDASAPPSPDGPAWTIEAHRTANDEVRAVCAAIRVLLNDGVSPGAIGVVARSLEPHDIDLVNRAAAEHGFGTTAAVELPLRAHRIGRAVATLLRLRERGFPRGEVFELLRDGLRTQRRIDLDRADMETRRARIAGGTSEELRPLSKRPVIDDYIAIVTELEALTAPLTAPMTGNDWAGFLTKTLSLFRPETALDLRAIDALDEIAARFRGVNGWNARFDLTTIEDAVSQETLVQAAGATPGTPLIWLGDVMRMRGRTFEHLFAIRMQDDVFPQRRVDDPLLPDSDRRILGVREIGDGREEERLLFHLLLDSAAGALHFTFAGGDGFGKSLRPSQLLKLYAVTHQPERKVALLKDFARCFAATAEDDAAPASTGRTTPRQLQLLVRTGTRGVFDGYIDGDTLRPHLERILQSVTPTQLEDFGECPQKFLFKHVLGATDIDQPERELQMHHREKGTLDHDILEQFYRGLESVTAFDGPMRERLHAIVDEAFDRVAEASPPFNRIWRDIERRATKRSLGQFVADDLRELVAGNLAPRHFEYRFGTRHASRGKVADRAEPFVIDAHGIPLRVEGRIDRIDEGESGTLRIVDYKSGKALRHKDLGEKIDRGVRLQLALYAMAVASFFERDPGGVHGAIKPLVLGGIKGEKFAFTLEEKAPRLVETLDLFARSILKGLFPAFPSSDDDDDVNACRYCPVAHSCRTRHDGAESYAVRRWKEPRALLEAWP